MGLIKDAIISAAALFSLPVLAQPFIEFGIGAAHWSCMADGWHATYDPRRAKPFDVKVGCSPNPLGLASVGYQHGPWSVRFDHWSSLIEKDRGANIVSVRYRHDFK